MMNESDVISPSRHPPLARLSRNVLSSVSIGLFVLHLKSLVQKRGIVNMLLYTQQGTV